MVMGAKGVQIKMFKGINGKCLYIHFLIENKTSMHSNASPKLIESNTQTRNYRFKPELTLQKSDISMANRSYVNSLY